MIVDCAVYRDGRRLPAAHEPGDIAAALRDLKSPKDFIWVGLAFCWDIFSAAAGARNRRAVY